MVRRILLMLGLLPAPLCAQQVFKCVDAGGVSYQSAPCGVGQSEEKAWDSPGYQPPPEADLERLRTLQLTAGREGKGGAATRRRSTRTADAASGIGACERAKAHRDRKLYEAGIRKSMQQLRAWDRQVEEACRR